MSEPDTAHFKAIAYPEPKPITIGHGVWIGARVTLKPGITIGTGAIIRANAMVTHDVPPYAIVVGLPALLLKMRFEDKVIEGLLQSHWWEYAFLRFAGLNILDPLKFCDELEELKVKGLKKFEPDPLTFEEIVKCYEESVAAVSPVSPAAAKKPAIGTKTPLQDWTDANLLSLYAGSILFGCKYLLPLPVPLPVLSPSCIQFTLSKDHAIHYEILFYESGVKIALYFERKWCQYASCMSDLLKQKLPL